jgi:signal transduction histidine kinase
VIGQARRLLTPDPYLQSLHLLLDLPAGVAFFTAAVTLLALGTGLAITLVGIPLLAVTVVAFRAVGAVERVRARVLLNHRVAGPHSFSRHGERRHPGSAGPGGVDRSLAGLLRRTLGDVPGWKAIAYSLVMLPWGVIAFSLTVALWAVGLSLTPSVVLAVALPGNWVVVNDEPILNPWARGGIAIVATVAGMMLLVATPAIVAGLATVDRLLVSSLLGRDRVAELEQRVDVLTESRDASLSGAATELARLERDLHDGTQQRLVSLAMELGVARERLAGGEPPDRVLPLVTAAHDSSKAAIAELRELVRGVQPAVLADRGLDAALSGLAARSPIPVQVTVEAADRPAPAVEAAAYFIAAEAVTNAVKHSGASHIGIDVRRFGPRLLVAVTDDGRGGAVVGPVGGLGGMRDRARSLEGSLTVDSPPGGPTQIRADLPCGS